MWTEHQLADFLDFVASDRLYAMWWLIALRGLRRGEAPGLRWSDVDLDGRAVTINQQRLAYGRTVAVGPPKTAASRRTVALDRRRSARTAGAPAPAGHRARRGRAGVERHTGYVFTTSDGQPPHPDYLTRRFRFLVEQSGLPPVRLHDHAAASHQTPPRRPVQHAPSAACPLVS